jgi:hypothetical protein
MNLSSTSRTQGISSPIKPNQGKSSLLLGAVGLLLALHPSAAQACAMCYGAVDPHTGEALNGAIFLMLGCVGGMLGLIVAVGISFVRRSRKVAEQPEFPH